MSCFLLGFIDNDKTYRVFGIGNFWKALFQELILEWLVSHETSKVNSKLKPNEDKTIEFIEMGASDHKKLSLNPTTLWTLNYL